MSLIKLSDAIENLREELQKAKDKGKDKELRFDIESIDVEFEITFQGESSAEVDSSAKTNLGIFVLGLGSKISSKNTDSSKHKIKISLKAIENAGTTTEKTVRVTAKQDEYSK